MSRPDKDTYYLDIALAVSKRSTCLRRRYGCVIVKDDVIVATGYNGSPRGDVNCCDCGTCQRPNAEKYTNYENCPAVHAEQNAMISVDKSHLKDATVYLAGETKTIEGDFKSLLLEHGEWEENYFPQPCNICNRMLKNAGVARVINRKGIVWD